MPAKSLVAPETDPEAAQVRAARAGYFDRLANPQQDMFENSDPNLPAPVIFHQPGPKTELPADASDLIVLGRITDARSYLSSSHRLIYTESTVRVETVVSQTSHSGSQVTGGQNIVIVQDGGAIQLPGGRVVKQIAIGSGNALEEGQRYLFFLIYVPEAQAYGCFKAWWLANGRVTAVSADDLARVATHTSTFDGMNEAEFLIRIQGLKASRK
jgi:hypothetical protein